ncbi:MAG: hypothetical protein WD850_01940 [Candidatus Spechtbacterales bacterium]
MSRRALFGLARGVGLAGVGALAVKVVPDVVELIGDLTGDADGSVFYTQKQHEAGMSVAEVLLVRSVSFTAVTEHNDPNNPKLNGQPLITQLKGQKGPWVFTVQGRWLEDDGVSAETVYPKVGEVVRFFRI